MRLGEARDGERGGDGGVEIGDRPAAKALQQRRGLQRKDRRADLVLASPAAAARRNRPEARPARRRPRSSSAARTCGSRVTPISSSATPSVTIVSTSRPLPSGASASAAASTSAGGLQVQPHGAGLALVRDAERLQRRPDSRAPPPPRPPPRAIARPCRTAGSLPAPKPRRASSLRLRLRNRACASDAVSHALRGRDREQASARAAERLLPPSSRR